MSKWRKAVALAIVGMFVVALASGAAMAAGDDQAAKASDQKAGGDKPTWGLIAFAAALAVGIGSIGAGIAVARVGSAALGAATERPELLMKSLIFVGLAEGIAIYGLLIAILLIFLKMK